MPDCPNCRAGVLLYVLFGEDRSSQNGKLTGCLRCNRLLIEHLVDLQAVKEKDR